MHIHQDNLLIVDDNPVNRKVLARQMESQGYDVIAVENGIEALSIVKTHDIDLVLLDIMMPEIDGMEVLRQLRMKQTMSQLPVIMVTARDQTEDVVEALDLGANDYLVKPVDLPVALAKIRTHLSFKRAEEALRESEERYVLAASGARDGLWDWDLGANEIYFSTRWKAMLGYDEGDVGIMPEDWYNMVHEDDLPILKQALKEHLAGKSEVFLSEHRIMHKDGSYRWILCRGKALLNADGAAYRIAGSNTDMTDLKVYDPLTGLPSKTLLLDRIERSKRREARQSTKIFALVVVNLDRFREINQTMGYSAGDQVLIHVTAQLKETLRSADTVAYLGKDEFGIMFDGLNDPVDAVRATTRVRNVLALPIKVLTDEVQVMFSAGISISTNDQTPEQMFHEAYTAMIRAKNEGGDAFEVFDNDVHSSAAIQVKVENDLRHSIDRNQLRLYYQPIYDIESKKVIGYEAMVRWEYGENGLYEPEEFMLAAERTGMISAIDCWAVTQAFSELGPRLAEDPELQLYINASGRIYAARTFVENLRGNIKEFGVSGAQIHLEFCESSLLELIERAPEILDQLHATGAKIGINQFGAEAASIQLLHHCHIEYIKLAPMLVLSDDKQQLGVLKAVCTAAEHFNVRVVAVGVDHVDHLGVLGDLNVRQAQGFYWSPPAPADQL